VASRSRLRWQTERVAALDEIEAAHAAVSGGGRGRRYATQQINQACVVILSSHFQGFCRNLYAEAVDHLVGRLDPPSLRSVVEAQMTLGLKLYSGNPNPANLGSDFGRLGIDLWAELKARSSRNAARQAELENLNRWRNAIAHQDFDPAKLGHHRTQLRLSEVRRWRSACDGLTRALEVVIAKRITVLVGTRPW
jgi:hypothetical protein